MNASNLSSKIVPLWRQSGQRPEFTKMMCEPTSDDDEQILPPEAELPEGLHSYAYMAARHWRQFRPRLYTALVESGTLVARITEAAENTLDDMSAIHNALWRSGMSGDDAHYSAWEQVRERYILLPAEEDDQDAPEQ